MSTLLTWAASSVLEPQSICILFNFVTLSETTVQETAIVSCILLPCGRELSWPLFSTWDKSKVQLGNRPFLSSSQASFMPVWIPALEMQVEKAVESSQASPGPDLPRDFARQAPLQSSAPQL